MTLFITAKLELLNQKCEKHDLSCLVPDPLPAETPAGVGNLDKTETLARKSLTGNGCCRETSSGLSIYQLIVRDRHSFSCSHILLAHKLISFTFAFSGHSFDA